MSSVIIPIGTTMAEAEKRVILATLNHYEWHRERTANALGISLKTLYNRLQEYRAERASEAAAQAPATAN